MKLSVFSTRALDPRDQFSAWETWFLPVFEISRERDVTYFLAENRVWDIGRDAHAEMAGLLDASHGSVLNSPGGYLLGEYMMLLDKWLPYLKPEDLPDRIALAAGEIGKVNLERARQAVRRHLKLSSLCPSTLCAIVGISRSKLYRLFEHAGGVGHYIQHQRLLAAYSTLSDPANRQSIRSISADFCFTDASTFSRAFGREFGQSPSDIRAAAISGIPISPLSRNQPNFESERFNDALV